MPSVARSLPRVSATILKDFGDGVSGCERFWAFKYKDKIPAKDSKFAEFGTEGHGHRELWLRDGQPPDLSTKAGRAALAGLKHLGVVPKAPGLDVERKFAIPRHGILWVGKADFRHPHPERAHVRVVGDHKFPGSFDYLADLATDEQRVLYATRERWEDESTEAVLSRWIYTLRNEPHTTRVLEFEEPSSITLERFDDVLRPRALRIVAALDEPSDARPKNFNHCSVYRGCPYIPICHATATKAEKFRSIMSATLMSKLRGAAVGTTAPAPAPAPGRDPELDRVKYDEPTARETNGNGRLSRLKGQATSPAGTSPTDVDALVEVKTPEPAAPAISPPESVHAGTVAPPEERPRRGRPRKAAETAAEPAAESAAVSPDLIATVLASAGDERTVRVVFHLIAMAKGLPPEHVAKHLDVLFPKG